MITWAEAGENPELMIKHKDDLKDVKLFREPWHVVFSKYPHLYREFSDRFDEMNGWAVACALMKDPTLVLDLKNYLHKMGRVDLVSALREVPALAPGMKEYLHKMEWADTKWLLKIHPKLSLCIKYKDNPDKIEAAYYIGYPHKLDGLGKEEKREMSERILELLKEEKT